MSLEAVVQSPTSEADKIDAEKVEHYHENSHQSLAAENLKGMTPGYNRYRISISQLERVLEYHQLKVNSDDIILFQRLRAFYQVDETQGSEKFVNQRLETWRHRWELDKDRQKIYEMIKGSVDKIINKSLTVTIEGEPKDRANLLRQFPAIKEEIQKIIEKQNVIL